MIPHHAPRITSLGRQADIGCEVHKHDVGIDRKVKCPQRHLAIFRLRHSGLFDFEVVASRHSSRPAVQKNLLVLHTGILHPRLLSLAAGVVLRGAKRTKRVAWPLTPRLRTVVMIMSWSDSILQKGHGHWTVPFLRFTASSTLPAGEP